MQVVVFSMSEKSNHDRPNCATSFLPSSSLKIKSRVSLPDCTTLQERADQVESETRVDELKAEIATLAQKLAEQDAQGHELARVNAKIRKNEDRYLVKRQTLSTRKEEYTNAVRDLGILPEEAYTKYVETSLDKVCSSSPRIRPKHRADNKGGQETA